MIPKTEKLLVEENTVSSSIEGPSAYMEPKPEIHSNAFRDIKPLRPLNDYVAVWLEANNTTIVLSEGDKYKNEGVVVGIGPNVKHVKMGDVVAFTGRALHVIEPTGGFYKNEKILLMTENSCLMVLKTIDFNLVSE